MSFRRAWTLTLTDAHEDAALDFSEERNPSASFHRHSSRRAHNHIAIRIGDDILSEEIFKSGHVPLLRGSDKGFQKLPLFGRTDGVRRPAVICFGLERRVGACFPPPFAGCPRSDGRSNRMPRVEYMRHVLWERVFQAGRAIASLNASVRSAPNRGIIARVHGFGKPDSMQVSRRERADWARLIHNRVVVVARKAGGLSTSASIRRLPPQPNVLHDIFGLRRTSEHAVGDAEESCTHAGKH